MFSIDLQKAFNAVPEPYLFKVLDIWDFGPHFLGILQALYSTPQAQVWSQGQFPCRISIAPGYKAGLPFIPQYLQLRPMQFVIQADPNIRGMCCGQQEHKCALLAADLLLFSTSTLISTPNVLSFPKVTEQISGLEIKVKVYSSKCLCPLWGG